MFGQLNKFVLFVLLLTQLAQAQVVVSGGVTVSGGVGFNTLPITLPTANAQLPIAWAQSKESDLVTSFDVTKNLVSDYVCTTGANCFAALQQAYCDWQAAPDQNWKLVIPASTLVQTGTTVTCTQTGATTYRSFVLNTKLIGGVSKPNKYFVIHSDNPLPANQTPCAHATDDTLVRQPPTGDISTWWTGGNNGCGNDIGHMWTLEGNWNPGNVGMLIQAGAFDAGTNLGPSHVIIADVEFRAITSNTSSVILVSLSIGSAYTAVTLLSQAPTDIHFYNFYLHADVTDWCSTGNPLGLASCSISGGSAPPGLGGLGNNRIASGVKLSDCQNCSVTWFYTDYLMSTGTEDHVIDVSRSNGPIKIAHGYISGGSMSIFTGGESFDDPLLSLNDVQITSNYMTLAISLVGDNYNGPGGIVSKNRLEVKVANRMLIEGNYIENQDTIGGQEGQCLELNPRNSSGNTVGNNYQVTVSNVTVRHNVCRNSLTGFSNSAYSAYPGGSGGGVTTPSDFWTFEYNLLYNLGSAFYDTAKKVTSPYGFRTSSGGGSHVCSGANAAGVLTFTCDVSVDGLRQVQIRVGDYVNITNCSQASWNVPANGTNVWENNRGAQAIGGTIQAGAVVVVNNPLATGSTATGCVLQATGGPFHQLVRHNTFVLQGTSYPSVCTSCASTKNVSGAASITSGLATVTMASAPIAVPNVAHVNVVGADIPEYNCTYCLVLAVSGLTITYATASANRAGDTIGAGTIQQPPNNIAAYNGGGTIKVFSDSGCTGAGPKNSINVTAWSRSNVTGLVSATVATTTGWPLTGASPPVSPQILVESVGNGTATGVFYFVGRTGSVITFSQPGANETGAAFGTLAQMGTCPGNQFAESNTYVDNLMVVDEGIAPVCTAANSWTGAPSTGWSGWINQGGSNLEGCPSGASSTTCGENHLDTTTSVVTNTNFPGRCMSKYMEVGGSFAGAIPPITLTSTPSSRCAGAAASLATCVGMKTMMNGQPFDAANPDPSQYVLHATSPYKQGGTNPASDSTDMGIGSFAPILAANHSVLYICPSTCGTGAGPYSD